MQGGTSKYVDVEGIRPIQPMFENSWSANLATFSVILEETQEQKTADLCVEAFIYSIKVCGYFNMKVERDAFVSSLFKFTHLGTSRPMQKKNLNAI
jgi:brefeldin A-inhibited guanine nucleotide-exchange protein